MDRETEVVAAIQREKIIAILRGIDPARSMKVAEALYLGGIHLMEFTYDAAHPDTWQQTADTIAAVQKAFEGKLFVGAGTVLSEMQAELTSRVGGSFVISPDTKPNVISRTRQLHMVSIPGAMTPTEIVTAYDAGASFVKVFPAGDLGVSYLKALHAPLSHIPMLVVGGIDEGNLAQFLSAGACGAGIGGSLARKDWIAAGEYEKLTAVAKRLCAAAGV